MAPALNVGRRRSTHSTVSGKPLSRSTLHRIERWWRAANYLSEGQIYLMDNPLLREPLVPEHVKPRLLGHWGTTPGLNFVYAHLNRVISERDLDMIYVIGPGHGGPGWVPRRTSKAPTARCTRRSGRTSTGCAGSFSSSRSRVGSRATSRRRRRGRSTRAESSVTRSRTRTARRSTTRTSWSQRSSGTERPI